MINLVDIERANNNELSFNVEDRFTGTYIIASDRLYFTKAIRVTGEELLSLVMILKDKSKETYRSTK
ncbi:MAG: hypothetical protein ACTSYA_04235 [Candidatus Kariarchaeaceae archaeon]